MVKSALQCLLLYIFEQGALAHLALPEWMAFFKAIARHDCDGIQRAVTGAYSFAWHNTKIMASDKLLRPACYRGRAKQLVEAMQKIRPPKKLKRLLAFYANSGLLDCAELHTAPTLPTVCAHADDELYYVSDNNVMVARVFCPYYEHSVENLLCDASAE